MRKVRKRENTKTAKTRKRQNGKTGKRKNLPTKRFSGFLGFLVFSVFLFSWFFLLVIVFYLCWGKGNLVFSVFWFSRFSGFLGFLVFSVFWFSRPRRSGPRRAFWVLSHRFWSIFPLTNVGFFRYPVFLTQSHIRSCRALSFASWSLGK